MLPCALVDVMLVAPVAMLVIPVTMLTLVIPPELLTGPGAVDTSVEFADATIVKRRIFSQYYIEAV